VSVQPSPGEAPGIRISDADGARYAWGRRPPLAALPGTPLDVTMPAPPPSTPAGPPVVLRTGMGSLRRSGNWQVPARLRVQSGMGSVVLDFCDAQIVHPVVEIEFELGAGSARVLLPDNASADIDGLVAGMGTVKSKVPSAPSRGATHFRIYGRATMGSVTVRRRYRLAGHWF